MADQGAETTVGDTDPKSSRSAVASLIALVVALALSAALLHTFIGRREFFLDMFRDTGVMLPKLTVIALSRLPAVLVGVLGAIGVLKELLVRDRIITFVVNGVHVCLLLLLSTIYTFAMTLPMAELIRQMGESP